LSKDPVMSVANLDFSYGPVLVLKGISFDVREGEYLSVIGPNGSGKTTLVKCLMGILPCSEAAVSLRGIPLTSMGRKEMARQVSYVPQAESAPFAFTVGEFVLMGRYPYLNPFSAIKDEDRHAAARAMETTDTSAFQDRPMYTLSGGERQKVFIAAALAQGARVLLLDEPTTFLDPKHADDVLAILAQLNGEAGVTVISVTHDVNIAAAESHRVLALKEGTVAFWGASEKVMEDDILETLFEKEFLRSEHPVTGKRFLVPGRKKRSGG